MSPCTLLFLGVVGLLSACSTDDLPAVQNDAAHEADTSRGNDARTPDATSPDATSPDASLPDATLPDATLPDAGPPPDVGDAGEVGDAGPLDAGTSDAGDPDVGDPDVGNADGGDPDLGVPLGETCERAIDATAGGSFVGDTTGAADDYSAKPSALNCPSGAVSGGDHVYRLAPTETTEYQLRVEPEGSFDPFLYVKEDCSVDACIDGTVLNGPGVAENLTVTVPAGAEYFVIVDGELLSEGAYTLKVTPARSGETCESAIDATAGGTFVGDTTGAADDYSAKPSALNCPSGAVSGGDHVYRLAPTVSTTYQLRVEPEGSFDPFLYVKEDCSVDACIDGTVLNGPGVAENLTVTVPAGAEYFVIVDGELLSEGAYTFIVTAP